MLEYTMEEDYAEIDLQPLEQVEVLDRIMGSGKTYAALRYVEGKALASKSAKWIYCTEFVSEIITRTLDNPDASHMWKDTVDADNKTDAFRALLCDPSVQLIAITHALLKELNSHADVVKLIAVHGWCLLLDETIDTITPYEGIKIGEFKWHKEEGRLTVDVENNGLVHWLDKSAQEEDKRQELVVRQLISNQGRVHATQQGSFLVYVDNVNIYKAFKRIIVSTYQFTNTIMYAYFKMHGVKVVECKDIVCRNTRTREDFQKLITMISKYDKKFDGKSLTATWYSDNSNRTAADFKLINNTIRSIGDGCGCAKDNTRVGYTMPKSALGRQRDKKAIQPVGYPHSVCLLDEQGNEIPGSHDKGRSGHISCNARASNEYACKDVMIHAFDRYPHVAVLQFMQAYSLLFSPAQFATNELVQWIWRSAIRHGKPIHLAILSKRMRKLFTDWVEAP